MTEPFVPFGEAHARIYDQQNARLQPLIGAVHFGARTLLSELPEDADILVVGVGTGAELLYLAEHQPGWRFTGIDPAPAMIEVCTRRVAQAGIAQRCTLHVGTVDELRREARFDAATCILVSHFLREREARVGLFAEIASRVKAGGLLVNAELAPPPGWESNGLMELWFGMLDPGANARERREGMSRHVAFASPAEIAEMMREGGFCDPVVFVQSVLIHAFYSRASASS